jgi:thiamine monophosphate kinase
VSTRTRVSAASAVVTVPVALKVGLGIGRIHRGRTELSGTVWPAVPHGRALLQRQGRRGRWITIAGKGVRPLGTDRSRYRFRLRPRRHAKSYRVKVLPRDGGAHDAGTSRTRRLRARPR